MTIAEVSSLASFLKPKHVMNCMTRPATVVIASTAMFVLHPASAPKLIHMNTSQVTLAPVISTKKIRKIMPEQEQGFVPSASIFLNKLSLRRIAQIRMYKA